MAVSETKSIAWIARRTVLSDNALSVLVPIVEETHGWKALRNRDLFTSCGIAIHEWDKIRTDWLTFHRIPGPFVSNETGTNDSKLLSIRVIHSAICATRVQIRLAVWITDVVNRSSDCAAPSGLRKKRHVFLKCRSSNA